MLRMRTMLQADVLTDEGHMRHGNQVVLSGDLIPQIHHLVDEERVGWQK